MRIGQMAREAGISIRMLRYYEDEGFISPDRSTSGYRIYGVKEIQILDRILLLKEVGLTLETIRKIIPCVRNSGPAFEPCSDLKLILGNQLANVDARIAALRRSREVLAGFLNGVEANHEAGTYVATRQGHVR
jgi:DNA-binding transcriptional MerR regulator